MNNHAQIKSTHIADNLNLGRCAVLLRFTFSYRDLVEIVVSFCLLLPIGGIVYHDKII